MYVVAQRLHTSRKLSGISHNLTSGAPVFELVAVVFRIDMRLGVRTKSKGYRTNVHVIITHREESSRDQKIRGRADLTLIDIALEIKKQRFRFL